MLVDYDLSGEKLPLAASKVTGIIGVVNLRGADLQESDFSSANLQAADLRDAVLTRVTLSDATLREANLSSAKLQGADLERANLSGASLRDACLQEAILCDADLRNTTGLHSEQLAGADLSGAELPEEINKFSALAAVSQTASYARKLFLAMLFLCLYSWLSIGATTDIQLLTNSSLPALPIVGTGIKIVGFYAFAPLILLAIFVYFHLYTQRMWRQLSLLPAKFPDGRGLDERADSWLLIGLVTAYFKHLKDRRPPFSKIQNVVSIFLAWWVVPITISWFWLRFLTRHELVWSVVHTFLVTASLVFAVAYWQIGKRTLKGEAWQTDGLRKSFKRISWIVVSVMAVSVLFFALVTFLTITGSRLPVDDGFYSGLPSVYRAFGYDPFADFREAHVSARPPGYKRFDINAGRDVIGADLKGANLTFVDALGAFLVNADLRGADLRYADLTDANLSGAYLQGADLRYATLVRTFLRDANLQDADLRGACLREPLGFIDKWEGVHDEQEGFRILKAARIDTTTTLPERYHELLEAGSSSQ